MQTKRLKTLDEIVGKPNFLKEMTILASQLVKESNKLPSREELKFHKNSTALGKTITTSSKLMTKQMEILTNYVNPKRRPIEKSSNGTLIFSRMIDYLDDLCENVDISLDKMKGVANLGENLRVVARDRNDLSQQDQISKNDSSKKPQNYFTDRVDNSETPFVPKIKVKHNAKYELSKEIVKANENPEAYFKIFTDRGENIQEFEFEHPYEKEINEFEVPEWALELDFEAKNPGLETPDNFTFVESWSALKKMMEDLKASKEIAIDLEHHSFRSYKGITCLIQISTRENDYVVDCIALRDHMHILNEVTSDPSKVKVLHGAKMDVKWLQRDFGVYIVNMFDTYHAVSRLGKSPFTLASLLFRYTKKTTDKKYQLADWRVRPLSPQMMKYARRDTHYLLYIYDCLKIDLINYCNERKLDAKKELIDVWNKSNGVCLLQYRRPSSKNRTYYTLLNNQKPLLTEEKIEIFKALWDWRDKIARQEDESTGYILPNNLLCKMSMHPPKKTQDIFRLRKRVPMKVKQLAKDIIRVVEKVKRKFNIPDIAEQKVLKRGKGMNLPKGSTEGIYVKEDKEVKILRLKFSEMKITEEKKDQRKKTGSLMDVVVESGMVEVNNKLFEIKKKFQYDNHFSYMRELYPELVSEMDFSEKQEEKKGEAATEKENMQNVETNDFMEFTGKEGEDGDSREAGTIDYNKILNNSIIPKSLRERFGVELQSKAAKKRYKDSVRRKLNKKAVKLAKLQTEKGNLLTGNVFEALRKDQNKKQFNESAFNNEEDTGNAFTKKLKLVEQNMLKSKGRKKRRNQVDFGLFKGGSGGLVKKIGKGKNKNNKKKAKFAKRKSKKFQI